jgi:phosphate transport system substrate-binding protein
MRKPLIVAITLIAVLILAACGSQKETTGAASSTPAPASNEPANLSGQIEIDGSSTVYPIMEAVAEEYRSVQPDVLPSVGVSGTGGGFKRFCAGETAISNASRPIKAEEAENCKNTGVEYMELQIAYDGLSVVISHDNDFVDYLTVEELAKIFGSENPAKTWKDVRDDWPAENILIFSPGADSGTFDYFNEEILDKKGLRTDDVVTLSEDDNTLVTGVAGSKYAIGYFGFAYYEENKDKLKAVPVDGGKGPIAPTFETIKDGSYSPLSRPLFIYVNKKEYERPEVRDFVTFFMDNAGELSAEVGYLSLPDENYAAEKAKL